MQSLQAEQAIQDEQYLEHERQDLHIGDYLELKEEKTLGSKYLAKDSDFTSDHGSMLHDINIKMQRQLDMKEWLADAAKESNKF